MNNKIIAFGIVLVLGLSMAQPSIDDYFDNRLEKAWCLDEYYGGELVSAGEDWFGGDMYGLDEDLDVSFDNMLGCAIDSDYACFNAEYANFMSILNQITALYFYYGVNYYIESPVRMGAIYEYYNMEVMPNLMDCLGHEGGLET